MKKTTHKIAQDLLIDDWFKMGGLMYRIDDIKPSFGGLIQIRFYPTHDTNSVVKLVMTVQTSVIFKTYNQK